MTRRDERAGFEGDVPEGRRMSDSYEQLREKAWELTREANGAWEAFEESVTSERHNFGPGRPRCFVGARPRRAQRSRARHIALLAAEPPVETEFTGAQEDWVSKKLLFRGGSPSS
jgi:hypothetical protein